MNKQSDINKAARQHLEMESLFAGFTIKKAYSAHIIDNPDNHKDIKSHQEQNNNTSSYTDKAAELDKIAEQCKSCRLCELGSLRTNAVPGEGNPSARIMFIGEAPGADEDAQGRPFVGRAGQLLDKIVTASGLKRDEVYIGNVLKCRPPDNRDPRAEEIISCLPYLQRQIEIIQPQVIIALGAHAARSLLNTTKSIGQMRGHFEEYYAGIGHAPIKLMATYHPAYLLRNYSQENRRRVWEDMKKVLAELALPIPS